MSLEKNFQAKLIKKIKKLIKECIVLKIDPTFIQGFPDLLILSAKGWAALECKRSEKSSHRPNQDYWVQRCDSMQFGRFVYPENEKEVLDELQHTL